MGPPPSSRSKPLRHDAALNREKILIAADRLMREHGLDVGHDQIAHAAGVAVGTVYRRFPDKASLINALFTGQVDRAAEMARKAAQVADPWQAIVEFLTDIIEMQASSRGLRELTAGNPHGVQLARYSREQLPPLVKALVSRAHAARVLRPDIVEQDLAVIPILVGGVISTSRSTDPQLWRRYLAIILAGIRAGDDDVLPGVAPTGQHITQMIVT